MLGHDRRPQHTVTTSAEAVISTIRPIARGSTE